MEGEVNCLILRLLLGEFIFHLGVKMFFHILKQPLSKGKQEPSATVRTGGCRLLAAALGHASVTLYRSWQSQGCSC